MAKDCRGAEVEVGDKVVYIYHSDTMIRYAREEGIVIAVGRGTKLQVRFADGCVKSPFTHNVIKVG